MKIFAVIVLMIGTLAVPAFADVDFDWSFGSSPTNPYGSGVLDATLVNGYPGLYRIVSGTGTITDSTGTYSVSIAGLTTNYGGNQGACGNVVDSSASCNTMRGVPGSGGANYTFDNLLYTGASVNGGQPFDANGIAFVGGGDEFLLTTTGYSDNGGGALYCGPEAPGQKG